MNEQLQGKLVEILSGIQSATKVAGDFAMEQLPDIAQSYVMYGRVVALMWMVAWLLAVIALVYATYRSWRFLLKDDDSEVLPFVLVPAGAALLSAWCLLQSTQAAAFVWFAPKVWLLKELAGLIK